MEIGEDYEYYSFEDISAGAFNETVVIKFAGVNYSHQIYVVSDIDCDYEESGQTSVPYGGLVSITPKNYGVLESFIQTLNSSGSWLNGKLSFYLDGNTGYLDFGNIDPAEIDTGGPWVVKNYAWSFYRVYVESI